MGNYSQKEQNRENTHCFKLNPNKGYCPLGIGRDLADLIIGSATIVTSKNLNVNDARSLMTNEINDSF